ncbi:uncharacterized protein LOC134232653, partial [Saccostrea cucullata]|uniref:uncharacterized protein LOC134232653 n=1 Tax=Saccostrea cuccullata TaxID=36930 RepID=UPI002ED108FB
MVKRCSWGTCNTDDRYPERLEGGVKFIPFPKPATNLEKCRRWIRLCERPSYQLNEDILRDRNKSKHFYVCTKHFIDGGQSEKYPDPLPALQHDRVTPSRPAPKRRQSFDCLNDNSKSKRVLKEIRVNENGEQEVQHIEDATVPHLEISTTIAILENCQPQKEPINPT